MSEMVERGKRAILALVPEGYGMTESEAEAYARAAIAAMREPTPQMEEAADMATGDPDCWDDCWEYGNMWRAMIDEALKEGAPAAEAGS